METYDRLDELREHPEQITDERALISDQRKKELNQLAQIIRQSVEDLGAARVIFICTHNSRRSQLAQILLTFWIDVYDLEKIEAYSGGTEVTAFNPRMVAALRRTGFNFSKQEDSSNPHYAFRLPGDGSGSPYFSKVYDHPDNPQRDFIAVLVCDQADAECPFIPGAYRRFSLPYEDPKAFDDTPGESKAYDEKVNEIGREMHHLALLLSEDGD